MCMGATKREGEWDDMTQLEAERLCDSRRDRETCDSSRREYMKRG